METVINTSPGNFGSTVHAIKESHVEGPLGKAISAAAHEKNAVRKAEATTEDVTINVSEQPAELIFKTSIEGINEALGENTITASFDADVNSSPEALSQTIVSLTTASYPQYLENNADIADEDNAQSIINIINQAMTNAVTDAKAVLTGLESLDEITSNMIDSNYDAVMQGVISFVDAA